MDKANPTADDVQPGISMAFGPVDDNMDVDQPTTNGASANGKRKASMTNGKNYKDASDSESDDVPLVRDRKHPTISMRLQNTDFFHSRSAVRLPLPPTPTTMTCHWRKRLVPSELPRTKSARTPTTTFHSARNFKRKRPKSKRQPRKRHQPRAKLPNPEKRSAKP